MIKGDLVEHIYNLMKGQLSDDEMLGVELGSGGYATVIAYIIDSIIEFFSHDKKDKIDRDIEKKLKSAKNKVSYSIFSTFDQASYLN